MLARSLSHGAIGALFLSLSLSRLLHGFSLALLFPLPVGRCLLHITYTGLDFLRPIASRYVMLQRGEPFVSLFLVRRDFSLYVRKLPVDVQYSIFLYLFYTTDKYFCAR